MRVRNVMPGGGMAPAACPLNRDVLLPAGTDENSIGHLLPLCNVAALWPKCCYCQMA